MNGYCYFSEGLNPAVTCNKNEGNRVAIPVLTPFRTMAGYMLGMNATRNGGF